MGLTRWNIRAIVGSEEDPGLRDKGLEFRVFLSCMCLTPTSHQIQQSRLVGRRTGKSMLDDQAGTASTEPHVPSFLESCLS